jgi:C4-dicarboxylate-specific signal transduction histidine kinase
MIGLNITKWEPNFSVKDLQNYLDTAQNEEINTIETTHIKKDGTSYTAQVSVTVIELDGIKSLYASARDITNIKQKDLLLIQQSKMAAMGEMLGNIAHQWRQPLTTISTKATGSIFQKEINQLTDEMFIQNMESINDSAQYLSQTIDIFRNFIRGNREIVILNVMDEIENSIKIIAGSYKNFFIEISKTYHKDTLTIEASQGELSQVIINLLNNAKDILLEKEIENPIVKIELTQKDNNAIITIEDNGGGIPIDIIDKIFEPYFTTKHQSQGTGLGLHMSYQIIKDSLGGKIYAKNTTNGAIFTIEIPLKKDI